MTAVTEAVSKPGATPAIGRTSNGTASPVSVTIASRSRKSRASRACTRAGASAMFCK